MLSSFGRKGVWGVEIVIVFFCQTPFPLCRAGFDFSGEFLTAGEFCNGKGVEAVDCFFVGEHDLKEFVELGGEDVFAVAGTVVVAG